MATILTWLASQPTSVADTVVLWDTIRCFGDTVSMESRDDWRVVPTELLNLEPDPTKAAADPGYYGREYEFEGDAVVENGKFVAAFWSAKGCMVVQAKTGSASAPEGANADAAIFKTVCAIGPTPTTPQAPAIRRCRVVRNRSDEVLLEVAFGSKDSAVSSALCSFDKSPILTIKPAETMPSIRLSCPLTYGVLPGFVGDDLILGTTQIPPGDVFHLPVEQVFLGLLEGGDSELVMTWPKGNQGLKLQGGVNPSDSGGGVWVDFDNDHRDLYVGLLQAPGLWHRQPLERSFLEKDTVISWKPPFAARWKTQLEEAGVQTSFAFRKTKGQIWRGVAGSYVYPVWLDGERVMYHLSKKVPPKGDSVVYFLEGENTPPTISTPVDILNATLGRQASDAIRDLPGRNLRTHHRRGNANVRRACTCGCTEAIQAIFEAGLEVENRGVVEEALKDMNFFVDRHVERIGEYRSFAADLMAFLSAQAAAAPELKPFCEQLQAMVQRIPDECRVQAQNLQSPEHAAELTRRTLALTERSSPDNLKAYMELLDAWRAMGGAQDYVLALCHTIARDLFQKAGYTCLGNAQWVPLAREVRTRCRQVLRNPDGYEIWADY